MLGLFNFLDFDSLKQLLMQVVAHGKMTNALCLAFGKEIADNEGETFIKIGQYIIERGMSYGHVKGNVGINTGLSLF